MHNIFRSRHENIQLKVEYGRLKESYQELEQLKDKLEHNEMTWQTNLTDAQKEAEQMKTEVAVCFCRSVDPLFVLFSFVFWYTYDAV